MAEPIERKYKFIAIGQEHGSIHDENDAFVFLAKDKAAPATLKFYWEECQRLGSAPRQLVAIALLRERVERYQAEHPDQVKVAEVDEGPIGDAIVTPNQPAD